MIKEYKVVSSDKGVSDFESQVLTAIQDGWQPIGGLTTSELTVDALLPDKTKGKLSMLLILQAMVK